MTELVDPACWIVSVFAARFRHSISHYGGGSVPWCIGDVLSGDA